jgi:hypothetical protein
MVSGFDRLTQVIDTESWLCSWDRLFGLSHDSEEGSVKVDTSFSPPTGVAIDLEIEQDDPLIERTQVL